MNNPDHIFKSLETIFFIFWGLKYLNSFMRIWDPGWKKVGSVIRDKHPGSATLGAIKKFGICFQWSNEQIERKAMKIPKCCYPLLAIAL
jgi:hypothetical protein